LQPFGIETYLFSDAHLFASGTRKKYLGAC